MNRNQAVRNILVSVGVADALGSDIEFNFHPNKQDFDREVNGGHPLRVTDDTQMSLFTAEALLKGYSKDEFRQAYLNWYRTQMAEVPVVTGYYLTSEPVLYSMRVPGTTCMQSLRELYRHKNRMRNNSKGNGTLMRCFPIVPYLTTDNLDTLVYECTSPTHDHIFAYFATKIAVLIGKGLAQGVSLKRLLDLYTEQLMMMGIKLPWEIKEAEQYGGGWVAEQALGIALWALWHGDRDWLSTVALATVHPGDSDTTAAIAGGFLGCQGIIPPERLQRRLDVLPVIDRLVTYYPQEEVELV